jgi:excisionase family DNA binding protein
METINFIGVDPENLINEIVNKVKDSLIPELEKNLKDNKSKDYLSAENICERFGVSKPTIHQWRSRGILKAYKLGSRVYYRLDEIENAMIVND